MIKIVYIPILLFLSVSTIYASPLIVRCSANQTWGNKDISIEINIALPDTTDNYLAILDRSGEYNALNNYDTVGVGKLEVTETVGKASQSRRHDFVVTRMPSNSNSLIGFYVRYSYVNSIRVDLWQKNKPFIYFDTFNNEILRGTCE